ncbi:hypothetical protein BASA81_005356 [Batrachochytrium salamandrivorans]|nr:hypothetical protein BASA81_005356 [Batrachochytrium salamandrivorans]
MFSCVLLAALAAFAATALYWSTRSAEQYRYSMDGKIIVDREFVQHGAAYMPFVRGVNYALSLLPEASLSFDHLVSHARWRCSAAEEDQLSNYSIQALRALTTAYEVDKPALTSVGRWMIHENLIGGLCTQYALLQLERDRPEIFSQTKISAVVIAGAPRTGSTHLLSTLCQHPNATCLTFAEATDPIAPGYLAPHQLLTMVDYRLWKNMFAALIVQLLRPLFPYMQKFSATTPMEEIILGDVFFASSVKLTSCHLPTYDKWFRETDHYEMEVGVRKLLQVIQYQRGGEERMWVLKSPQNANQLGPKSRVYPNSQFVFTHRRALPVVQSLAGMIGYMVGMFSDPSKVDQTKFIADWVDHQQWSQERILPEEIAKHLNTKQVLHVKFDEYMAHPVTMALSVAKHAGLSHGQDIFQIFTEFQLSSPQEGSKVLKYDLDSFGVTAQTVQAKFAKYQAAYDL